MHLKVGNSLNALFFKKGVQYNELYHYTLKENDIKISGAEKYAWAIPERYFQKFYKGLTVPIEELYMNTSHRLGIDWKINAFTIEKKGPNRYFAINFKLN